MRERERGREGEKKVNSMFVNLDVMPESSPDFPVKDRVNFLPFCLVVIFHL